MCVWVGVRGVVILHTSSELCLSFANDQTQASKARIEWLCSLSLSLSVYVHLSLLGSGLGRLLAGLLGSSLLGTGLLGTGLLGGGRGSRRRSGGLLSSGLLSARLLGSRRGGRLLGGRRRRRLLGRRGSALLGLGGSLLGLGGGLLLGVGSLLHSHSSFGVQSVPSTFLDEVSALHTSGEGHSEAVLLVVEAGVGGDDPVLDRHVGGTSDRSQANDGFADHLEVGLWRIRKTDE